MNIIEKRSRIRDLKKAGTIPAHAAPMGSVIVSLTNEDADRILAQWDTEFPGYTGAPAFERGVTQRELEPAPAAPRSNGNGHAQPQPAPAGDLAAIIAALVAPHVQSSVSQEQFDTLATQSETLAARLEEIAAQVQPRQTREIVVSLPDGAKREIGTAHYRFDDLLTVVSCNVPAYLPGPAGSFKSHTAALCAKALGLEFSAVSVCQQTTAVTLLGYMNAAGNYVTTDFRRRYEHGGVFLLDEIDNGNANTISVLNAATSNGHCAFPDGMIARHPDFRLIATANTYGNGGNSQYVGRNPLDAATLDRFAFLQWGYDEHLEELIANGSTTIPAQVKPKGTILPADQWPAKIRALRRAVESLGSRLIISPRATFNGARLLSAGMDLETVMEVVIWKGTSAEERQKIEARAN